MSSRACLPCKSCRARQEVKPQPSQPTSVQVARHDHELATLMLAAHRAVTVGSAPADRPSRGLLDPRLSLTGLSQMVPDPPTLPERNRGSAGRALMCLFVGAEVALITRYFRAPTGQDGTELRRLGNWVPS